jgi:hypothetical protein
MRRRSLRLLLAVSLFAGMIPALSASALARVAAEETGAVRSPNMTHVKNLEYAARNGTKKNAGTDLEFIDIDVTGQAGAVAAGVEGVRSYSLAGSYNNGLQIVDITDPENSSIIGVYDCGISQGDVQVFTREVDGVVRTFATFTQDTGYGFASKSACYTEAAALGFSRPNFGTFIADITDPYNPVTVSYIRVALGSHNGTMHPGGDYFYNSNSELITNARNASIEVIDIRDFNNPQQVATIPISPRPGLGTDSHDLTFNAKGDRAYSAALSQGLIIDTTDPAKPKLLTSFLDPAINVWHQSDPVTVKDPILGERTFLVVEDEVAGATGTGQCPNGGVHVYDITGQLELAPVKVGYWNVDQVRTFNVGYSCTAHVFDIHDDTDLMTIAYYQGGVHVVDLSGLVGVALGKSGVGMKQLGFYYFEDKAAGARASNTWAVKAPKTSRDGSFYLYGNDQNRGFDVYKFDNAAPATTEVGRWMTPQQALAMTKQYRALNPKVAKPFCLLGDRV